MKHLFIMAILAIYSIVASFIVCCANSSAICTIDTTLIDSFYFDNQRTFQIADTQAIPNSKCTVSWYVDTDEWDFDPNTNHIFSKIVFRKGISTLATFGDNEGWSYIGIEDSRAQMFKSFKINSDYTAIVFMGGVYGAGTPKLTIFVLSDNKVELVFNKEYFIEGIKDNKIIIKKNYNDSASEYISITNGHISIFTKEYTSGKIIF